MKSKALLLSLVLAAIAALFIYLWLEQQKSEYVKMAAPKKIVIAAKDINELSDITEDMLTYREIPNQYVQPGSFTNIDEVVGKISAVPIKKGEQILSTKLYISQEEINLSSRISKGKRAISIPVDDITGVCKLIRPGDRVDLVANFTYQMGRTQQRETITFLQNVLILAVGKYMTNMLPRGFRQTLTGKETIDYRKNYNYTTVTLELTPYEVQKVVYALNTGATIYLSLRNQDDNTLLKLYSTDQLRVLGPYSIKARRQAILNKKREPSWTDIRGSTAIPRY